MNWQIYGKEQIGQTSLLKIGQTIYLVAGPNFRNPSKIEFLPEFCGVDRNAKDSGSSMRFFNPVNNGFFLQKGEVWSAEIVEIELDHFGKEVTRDSRQIVIVEINVLKREEHLEKRTNYDSCELVFQIWSGKRMVGFFPIPIEIKKKIYRRNGSILAVNEVLRDGQAIDFSRAVSYSVDEFFSSRGLNKGIDKSSLLKRIPEMPKEYESFLK